MSVNLTKREIRLVRWACEVAIGSEREFMGAWIDKKGKVEPRVASRSKANIAALTKMRARLFEVLFPTP